VTVAGSQVQRVVDLPSVVRERLTAFGVEVLAEAMNRPVQGRNGGLYLRGLIEDGARKSLEPLVSRLGGDAEYQSTQQFLADSPWDSALVVQAVAERVAPEIEVEAWVLDDIGFPKDGKDSPGVKRQYSGTLGKIGNCQIGVSVHAVGKTGTVPLGWALYLPGEWCEDPGRRRKAKIPDEVQFKTKVELGAELVERACGWEVPRAPVLGDHDYGRRGRLRERLDQAGCEYVLPVGPEPLVFEHGTCFERKTKRGGARKRPRPDRPPEPLGDLIARLGESSAQTVSFRERPDGEPVTAAFHSHARARRASACASRGSARSRRPRITHRRRAAPTRGMADRRMALGRGEPGRLLALKPPR
jgi:SRSO17 transposase